jgi:Mrp family chromosome partitioning ATPase
MKLRLVEVTPQLTVLPAGPPNPDPMGGLTSERMRRIIEEASARFEWVVLDTPPVGLLPDANLLAEMVDMIVFVVGAGATPYTQVQRAMAALDRNRVVGVVLNRVTEPADTAHYYGYYTRQVG